MVTLIVYHMLKNGCPWDEIVCTIASENDNLDCLSYAHENGCPWDEGVVLIAIKFGSLNCLKYAYNNGLQLNNEIHKKIFNK